MKNQESILDYKLRYRYWLRLELQIAKNESTKECIKENIYKNEEAIKELKNKIYGTK